MNWFRNLPEWAKFWLLALPSIPLILLGVLAALGLVGCAAFDQRYTKAPTRTVAMLSVQWATSAEIRKICQRETAFACVDRIPTADRPLVYMVAQRPQSFSDLPAVCAIGHEVLHALGGEHF